MLNPNKKIVDNIRKALIKTKGQCPCIPSHLWNKDTICPCKDYKKTGICKCKLFV